MSVVIADRLSKWYGHVLGVSDVSWTLKGGIVGLLGPNGAGKSTMIKMMAGLLRPSRGALTVFGKSPFEDVGVRRRIGYAPEHEKTWDSLTALELVEYMARLEGVRADDWFFGVSAIGADGVASPIASALTGGAFAPGK